MRKHYLFIAVLLLMGGLAMQLPAQSRTVKLKQEKTLQGAHEFIVTWEGGEYKPLYYEVRAILDGEPMVTQVVFLHQLQRISAVVREPWTFEHLKALFEAHGFAVMNKNVPAHVDTHR
jgi:hypothetical protein